MAANEGSLEDYNYQEECSGKHFSVVFMGEMHLWYQNEDGLEKRR